MVMVIWFRSLAFFVLNHRGSEGITQKRGLCGHTCNSSMLFSPQARNWQYNYGLNLTRNWQYNWQYNYGTGSTTTDWQTNQRCRALAASPSYDFVPMVQHCSPIDCSQLYNAATSISPQANKILAMNEPNE